MGARQKLAESARRLKAVLSWRAWNNAGSRTEIRETEELLRKATEQLEQHDAEFYEYAPLFPYAELPDEEPG